ncbi:hypothetical protein [Nonomuraea sp. NPDC003709]|uniref:hypothetical protein n=1 Tax=Nonomuraea sp. NPDC003709 TaxID=3154450 RepID=UPI0033BEE1DF
MVLPEITPSYFAGLTQQITDAARRHQLSVNVATSNGDVEVEREHVAELARRRVSGVILISVEPFQFLLGRSRRGAHAGAGSPLRRRGRRGGRLPPGRAWPPENHSCVGVRRDTPSSSSACSGSRARLVNAASTGTTRRC